MVRRSPKAESAFRAMMKEKAPAHDEYLRLHDRDSRLAKAFGGAQSGPLSEDELHKRYPAIDGSMGGGPTAAPGTSGEAAPGQPVKFEKRLGGDPE